MDIRLRIEDYVLSAYFVPSAAAFGVSIIVGAALYVAAPHNNGSVNMIVDAYEYCSYDLSDVSRIEASSIELVAKNEIFAKFRSDGRIGKYTGKYQLSFESEDRDCIEDLRHLLSHALPEKYGPDWQCTLKL